MAKPYTFTTDIGAKCDYCGTQMPQGTTVTTTGRYDYCADCVEALEIQVKPLTAREQAMKAKMANYYNTQWILDRS